MYHTHKRPDRESYVDVIWDNVAHGKEDEFRFCEGCCCDTWGFEYDCESVMHYAKNQMSNGNGDTLGRNIYSCASWILF